MAHRHLAYTTREARYRQARWWLDQGIDVVPMQPVSKRIERGFGARKHHISEVAEAENWFLRSNANLGVVLGSETRLVVADWDDVDAYDRWHETKGRSLSTRTEQTARGWHLFYFCQGLKSGSAGGCDFLASGVCMVTPSIHPSGAVYRVVDPAPIADLSAAEAIELFPFLSEKLVKTTYRHTLATAKKGGRRQATVPAVQGQGVVARIKAARSTAVEMIDAGVDLRPGGTNALVGRCPFHDDHHPSLWVNPESGLWGCNRPDCPAAGIHDVINFRAMIKRISNRDAIRELAKECL